MNLRLAHLPNPPAGAAMWSIVTLAAHLCVPPAVVGQLLIPDPAVGVDGSPDVHAIRLHHSYRVVDRRDLADYWLTDEAADRIAAQLPAGLLARRITAGHPSGTNNLGPDQVYDLARHIVEHLGGGR